MSIRLVCATFVLAAGMSIHRFSMKVTSSQVPPGSTDFTDFQVYSEESKPNVTVTGDRQAATFAANNATRVEVLLLNEEELSAVLRHNNASVPAGAVLCTPTGVSFPSELARDPPTYSSCDTARNSSFLLEFSGEGTYTLVFAACSARGSEVSIAGEVIGPRPADKDHPLRIVSLRQFNRTMAQTYVCVLLFWLGLLLYYRATAIAIQKWVITGVLLCCFCEHFTAYADWKYYELQGTHHPVFVGASLLLNAWKNSISRMLLVVLCLGFGVVKSEVGPNLPKVVLLGFAYFASYLAYNVILYFFHTDVTSSEVLFAATLPIACLDVGFYYWTLTSIKAVKRVLKELKWEFKLQVYERMTSILILSVILSVAWLCIEL